MRRRLALAAAAAAAALVALAPDSVTRAAWNDAATVAAPASRTLTVTPTLACTPDGSDAVVSWSQPPSGSGFAPVTYTATIRRGGGATSNATGSITADGAARRLPVAGSITVTTIPVVVTVTGSLPGSTWTGTSTITLTMNSLVAGGRLECP